MVLSIFYPEQGSDLIGTQFYSIKTGKFPLVPWRWSCLHPTSAESHEGIKDQGGRQNLPEAVLVPSHLLVGHRTRKSKKSTALLLSGRCLKLSGTNLRCFHAVMFLLLSENTPIIPPASPDRGTASRLQCRRMKEPEPTSSSKSCPRVAGRATACTDTTKTWIPNGTEGAPLGSKSTLLHSFAV